MLKKILLSLLLTTTPLLAQSWGINIGGFSFSNNNNNCYNRGYYIQSAPVITYMPQNVYMRPYQYMPAPQPVIINSYPTFTPTIPFTPYAPNVIYQSGGCYRR
jgi:hypothetical protein